MLYKSHQIGFNKEELCPRCRWEDNSVEKKIDYTLIFVLKLCILVDRFITLMVFCVKWFMWLVLTQQPFHMYFVSYQLGGVYVNCRHSLHALSFTFRELVKSGKTNSIHVCCRTSGTENSITLRYTQMSCCGADMHNIIEERAKIDRDKPMINRPNNIKLQIHVLCVAV